MSDETQPNDIEYPDECPACGFEPVDTDAMAADADSPEGFAKEFSPSEFWQSTTTTNSSGEGSLTVSCPECGHKIVDITVDSQMADAMGFGGVDEDE